MVSKKRKIISNGFYFFIQSIKSFFLIPRGCCRFSPTCSEYAKEALETLPAVTAISAIIKRIIKCHPFNAGGYDPVKDHHFSTKG